MRKLFIAAFMFVSIFGTKVMADIKMGIILGFTGPIESVSYTHLTLPTTPYV